MKTISVKKDLGSKKVAMFKEVPTSDDPEPLVAKWLKPGDKLKTDDSPEHMYDPTIKGKDYMKVYYNGQTGWIVTSAIRESLT